MSFVYEDPPISVLCLRVTAEADPGALARVLERFQNINIVPRRVRAEWGIAGQLHVDVHVSGIRESTLALIAEKLGQVPCIVKAGWHRL